MYSDGKQQFRGRSGTLHVPVEIGSVVEAVLGIDTRRAARPQFIKTSGGIRPEVITGHTPNVARSMYSFPSGLTGAGQCIGIIELGGGYNVSDITAASPQWHEAGGPPLLRRHPGEAVTLRTLYTVDRDLVA